MPARGSQHRRAQPRGTAPRDLGWGRCRPGGLGDPRPTAPTSRHHGLGFAPPSKGQRGTADLPGYPPHPQREADHPQTGAVAPHPTAPRPPQHSWGWRPSLPPTPPPAILKRCRSVFCSVPPTAAPSSLAAPALPLPPPTPTPPQHPSTAAHPITHWASLVLGTHLPALGAWAQHVLLGAGGLVIGAVIAVSNDTLSWLPLARPQKAGSVHLSLQGGGGAQLHGSCSATTSPAPVGKLRHEGSAARLPWRRAGLPEGEGQAGPLQTCYGRLGRRGDSLKVGR